MPLPALPILDLSLYDASPEARLQFLQDLSSAAREVGFFYLKGHGIAPDLGQSVFDLSHRFFALPEADKLTIEMVHSPHFRGYTRVGKELTRGLPDRREQLDIGLEVPARRSVPVDQPWLRLEGPNQWPIVLPELKPALLAWQDQLTAVLLKLLKAFALALEQPESAFDTLVGSTASRGLKIIRYPGVESPQDDQGVGAHKDSGILTAVYQDGVAGLQVETDTGWVTAEPIPGTFVINIGELLELATDGYLRATVHRVVSPPAGRERLSVAYFLGARLDARVEVLPLPAHLKPLVRGVAADPLNPLFHDVGPNSLKGRLRSHVDVAQRHYSDLLAPASLT